MGHDSFLADFMENLRRSYGLLQQQWTRANSSVRMEIVLNRLTVRCIALGPAAKRSSQYSSKSQEILDRMRGCQLLKKRSDAFVRYKTNHSGTSNKMELFHIKNRLMHTFIINTVSFRYVSALKGPSSRSMTDTFQQQGQPDELPDPKFSLVISVQYRVLICGHIQCVPLPTDIYIYIQCVPLATKIYIYTVCPTR